MLKKNDVVEHRTTGQRGVIFRMVNSAGALYFWFKGESSAKEAKDYFKVGTFTPDPEPIEVGLVQWRNSTQMLKINDVVKGNASGSIRVVTKVHDDGRFDSARVSRCLPSRYTLIGHMIPVPAPLKVGDTVKLLEYKEDWTIVAIHLDYAWLVREDGLKNELRPISKVSRCGEYI